MGGENDRCAGCGESVCEFVYEGDRKVVGRLVEEQYVRFGRKYHRQVETTLLPHRQFTDPLARFTHEEDRGARARLRPTNRGDPP